jgi:hypothetical protein
MPQLATAIVLLLALVFVPTHGTSTRYSGDSRTESSTRAKITSDPDGAAISIDGKPAGVTPAVVIVPAGDHSIVLVKEGFRSWICAVSIGSKTSIRSFQGGSVSTADPDYGLRLGARLEADADTAKEESGDSAQMVIQSTPSGADVILDGKSAGATPLTVVVPAGDHNIQLKKDGYKPQTAEVSLEGGSKNTRIGIRLQKDDSK